MDTVPHLSDTEIAAYLDRDLSPDARKHIERHLDGCADCRAELVAVHELAASAGTGVRRPWRRSGWWIPVALAAGLAGVALVRGGPGKPTSPIERPAITPSEGLPRLQPIAPSEAEAIPATSRTFAWRPFPAGTYRFALLTADGAPVWTTETADTTVTLPLPVTLSPGAAYFWRVDAVRDGLAATTGVIRFTVDR